MSAVHHLTGLLDAEWLRQQVIDGAVVFDRLHVVQRHALSHAEQLSP